MRHLRLLSVLLLVAGCAGGDAARETAGTGEPPRLPSFAPSVVFGPAEAPTGGEVAIGLLIPSPPSVRLVDRIPPALWEEYLAQEARIADGAAAPRAKVNQWHQETPWDWNEDSLSGGGSSPWHRRLDAAARAVLERTNVRISFQNVLASECADLPAVIVDGVLRFPGDREHLVRYVESGGLVFRTGERPGTAAEVGTFRPALLQGGEKDLDPLVEVCLEVIRTSPVVERLDADPLAPVSAVRDGDEVVVRFADATTEAIQVGVAGEVRRTSDGALRFTSPDLGDRAFRDRLVVTWSDGETTLRRAWRVVDLVGTAERRVFAPKAVQAGAPYAPRVLVLNTLTGAPVKGRRETLSLTRGDQVLARAEGVTDATGSLDARLLVPVDVKPGAATLTVGADDFPVTVAGGMRVSVVTDRGLYRPTDDVHVRVMVHEAARGRPVASRSVTLKLLDVEKTVTTSDHGIASATFRLVDARLGWQRLTAKVDGVEGASRLRILAFERPTFTVETDPPSLALRPGEAAPLRVRARYVNDTPVLGARVFVSGRDGVEVRPSTGGRTNARGLFETEVRAGEAARSGVVSVSVTDADGRTVETALDLTVSTDARTLSVARLEDVVAGRPCRLQVRASEPGPVDVFLDDRYVATVDVGASGSAEVDVDPPASTFEVRLGAEDATPCVRSLKPFVPAEGQPLLGLARRAARVGETLALSIDAPDGAVWVDVLRDGTCLRALSAPVRDGSAQIALPLEDDLAGVLTLRAWRLEDGEPVGSALRVLVTRDRALDVRATPGRAGYRPAETAVVDVEVRDRRGEPTAAVLGYWGVDEALLALQPLPDGFEEVFDALPPDRSAELGVLAGDAEHGRAAPFEAAEGSLGGIERVSFPEAAFHVHRSVPFHERALRDVYESQLTKGLKALRSAYVKAYEGVPVEELCTAGSPREALAFVVTSGRLAPENLLDPWGTPLELGREARIWRLTDREERWRSWQTVFGVFVGSAGPDLRWGTADDLRDVWRPPAPSEIPGPVGRFLTLLAEAPRDEVDALADAPFWGPSSNGLIGLGGGAGGAFGRGCGGDRSLSTGASQRLDPVHVRKDLEPTLCFVPEAIVGPEGALRLEIPLKDSITTWRLRLTASAADGATGVGETRLRVSQPLHVDPWIAPHLTVGDELELPVAVRNETDGALDVALRLETSEHLEVLGERSAVVSVPAGGTGAQSFRYRAVGRGSARIRVDAVAGEHRDAIERVVSVRPNAREVVDVANGSIAADSPWQAALPVLAAGVPHEHRVSVYPSPLAETLDGFEGLIACPHG